MSIQEMRQERLRPNVRYVEYIQNKRSNPNAIHCFFEGKTDTYYYLPRLEYKFTEEGMDHIYHYVCHSKSNVINLYNRIKERNEPSILRTLYFVDKDYDSETNKDLSNINEVYITPTHSMETFYTHKETFIQTVLRENGWSDDESYRNNVVFLEKFYEREFRSYLERIIKVCAWFKFQCEMATEERYADLQLINLDEKFKINGIKSTNVTLEELKELTPDYFELDEKGLEKEMQHVMENPYELIQGKFIFPFILVILKKIKSHAKKLEIDNLKLEFAGNFRLKIHLNVAEANLLSHLSPYALTPRCLKNYINNKHKLILDHSQ